MSETSGELSGSKAPGQSLDLRSARLAHEAGQKAARQARELLDRHADIIGTDVAEIVELREFTRASEAAKQARTEGRSNDQGNDEPGLTAIITKAGYEGLTELAEKKGEDSYVAGYVAGIKPVEAEGGYGSEDSEAELYAMRLPQGVYAMGFGGATFYGEVTTTGEGGRERENPFSMPYDSIVRIEADGGEMWQNFHFNPDGTPK